MTTLWCTTPSAVGNASVKFPQQTSCKKKKNPTYKHNKQNCWNATKAQDRQSEAVPGFQGIGQAPELATARATLLFTSY